MQTEIGKLTEVQPVQVVRLELTDVDAMEQLSQKRKVEDYDPEYMHEHRFLLPPNVDRFLYSPEALEDMQKVIRVRLVEDAHIRIIKQRLLCTTARGTKACYVPLHVTTSFRYNGTRITGQHFVSMLHAAKSRLPENLWNEPWAAALQEIRYPLSPRERQILIEDYLRAYLHGTSSCTDFTFIGIPSKAAALREESPTHWAFTRLAVPCGANNAYVIPVNGLDTYVFAHGGNTGNVIEHAQKLLADPKMIEKLTSFIWSLPAIEKQQAISKSQWQIPEYYSLYLQQVTTVIEWLRVTWKERGKDLWQE